MTGSAYIAKKSIEVIEQLEEQIRILREENKELQKQLSTRLEAETETFQHITRKHLEDEQENN